jgi:hypothetical protein
MPRVAAKPKDDELVVAVDSACVVGPDGSQHDVYAGMRLRRSHPAVLACPRIFAPADSSDDELAAARRQLLEEAWARGAGAT